MADQAKIQPNARAQAVARLHDQVTGGGYYVENSGQRIGPFSNQGKAHRRLHAETTIAGESGNTGKAPELVFVPKGSTPDPAFSALHRLSPKKPAGNGPDSRGWDYRTNQQVRRDDPATRAMKPRGYQGR